MRINKKKFIYLISPTKISKSFYDDLTSILKLKKVSFFQLRLKKDSFKKTFPLKYHLIYQEDLEENSFLVNNEDYTVPCVFQIWKHENHNRNLPVKHEANGYHFVKKEEEPDYSLRRVGVYAGKIDSEIDSKSIQSHYFIKLDKDIDNFIEKYNLSVKFEHNNTVGAKSISKQEFIKEINKIV